MSQTDRQPSSLRRDNIFAPSSLICGILAWTLLPLLAADRAAALYPEVEQKPSEHNAFCPDGNGALFRYKDRDLWCVARHDGQFVIAFPDKTRWTVSPINDENPRLSQPPRRDQRARQRPANPYRRFADAV